MRLSFKSKEESNRTSDIVVEQLSSFILKNNIFLGGTISILAEWKMHIEPESIEEIVKNESIFENDIKKNEKYKEFIELLKDFYSGDDDKVNERRGRLLEILWDRVGVFDKNYKDCEKVTEAQVYDKGNKISEKDIDIVYFNENKDQIKKEFIELHECKSSAKSTLRTPLRDRHRLKLELMKETKSIADKEKIMCDAYIITFEFNTRNARRILDRYQFNTIKIITGSDITQRICNI